MDRERAGHGEAMPGRLNMEDQGNKVGSQGFKKDRSHVSEATGPLAVAPASQAQTNGLAAASGPHGVMPNGVSHKDTTNGTSTTYPILGPPPPLDQSWREGPENKSLGKLMIRTAEKCWVELSEVLQKMAESPVPAQEPAANGATPETDTDAVSLRKKRQLMDFAQTQRDRFMKALVISDWAKDADAFAGIIDVNAHLGRLNACHAGATSAVGEMKLAMNQAKMPNPNIEGALELLGTGKFNGLPDFNYITPPKMTAKELLRTLKDMNVTLATRLSLHEELPAHFNDYTIADGRATFRVAGEFAVDLAVADEDAASPFFFIELRFLFTPAPNELSNQIQNFCEMEVNKSMAANGLQGCYDILHNFILTHKLNVLHSQLGDLVRGKWFESIRVERIRRNLALSYWTGRPGRKSWIELGIGSGRTKLTRPNEKTTSVISMRWFQRGLQVQESELDIDWHCISLEAILLQAIARHTSSILRHVQHELKSLASGSADLVMELGTSDHEPNDCELVMSLPSLRTPVRCTIEPVTGQFSISPSTVTTRHAQQRLNSDPNADIPARLASTVCEVALELVEKQAATLSWRPVLDLARQNDYNALFGKFAKFRTFAPSQAWGTEWAIAVTASLGGNRWWIVQLKGVQGTSQRIIINAKEIRKAVATDGTASRSLLLEIEKAAVAEVSFTALAMQLDHMQIPYDFERPPLIKGGSSSRQKIPPSMFIKFGRLMSPSRDPKWKAWAQEVVRLSHHGDEKTTTHGESNALLTRHNLRLSVERGAFHELRKHLKKNGRDGDILMNDTGGLAIKLHTKFGVPFVDQIRTKLSAVERLDRNLTVLKNCGATYEVANFSQLAFNYSSDPALSAHLTYSNDSKKGVKLRLEPSETNPQQPIRDTLEQDFTQNSETSFADTVHALYRTLPVWRTYEQLQAKHTTEQSLLLHKRSTLTYTLKFSAPFPRVNLWLRLKPLPKSAGGTKGKLDLRWLVEQEKGKEILPEDLQTALRELWGRNDEHCLSLGANGVAADDQGIGSVLESIDEIVRRFKSDAPALPATTTITTTTSDAKSKPTAQQEVIALD